MSFLTIFQSFLCGIVFVVGSVVGLFVAARLVRSENKKAQDALIKHYNSVSASLEKQSAAFERISDFMLKKPAINIAMKLRASAAKERQQPAGRDMDARDWAATCLECAAEDIELEAK